MGEAGCVRQAKQQQRNVARLDAPLAHKIIPVCARQQLEAADFCRLLGRGLHSLNALNGFRQP